MRGARVAVVVLAAQSQHQLAEREAARDDGALLSPCASRDHALTTLLRSFLFLSWCCIGLIDACNGSNGKKVKISVALPTKLRKLVSGVNRRGAWQRNEVGTRRAAPPLTERLSAQP